MWKRKIQATTCFKEGWIQQEIKVKTCKIIWPKTTYKSLLIVANQFYNYGKHEVKVLYVLTNVKGFSYLDYYPHVMNKFKCLKYLTKLKLFLLSCMM